MEKVLLISKFGTIFMISAGGVNVGTSESMQDAIQLASAVSRGLQAYDVPSVVRVGNSCAGSFEEWRKLPHILSVLPMLSKEFLTMVDDQ